MNEEDQIIQSNSLLHSSHTYFTTSARKESEERHRLRHPLRQVQDVLFSFLVYSTSLKFSYCVNIFLSDNFKEEK